MTAPYTVASVGDGKATTVNDLIGAPMAIPARVIPEVQAGFLTDVVFRDAGEQVNGLVSYEESTPLFLGSDVQDIAEFAEIPVAVGQRGLPRLAISTKKGLGIRVSLDMRRKNKVDDVNRQITQLVNTMHRADARMLRRALTNPAIPSIAAVGAWGTTGSRARRDFGNAQEVIGSAKPAGFADEDVFGFVADAVILPASIAPVLMDDDDFLKIYTGDLASQNIAYTGVLPRKIGPLDGYTSRFWPPDRALVLMKKTVGFYSDARPLTQTGLYPEGNGPNGGPTESWRSDVTHERVIGTDQPLAACWITGITEP